MVTAYGVCFLALSGLCDGLLIKILVLLNFKTRRRPTLTVSDELQATRAHRQEKTEYEEVMTE